MSDEGKYKRTIRATKYAYSLSIPAVFRDRLGIQERDRISIKFRKNKMYIYKSHQGLASIISKNQTSKVYATGNGKSMNFTIPVRLVAQHKLETCPTLDVYLKGEVIIYELT